MKKSMSAILLSIIGLLAAICLASISFYQTYPDYLPFLKGIMDNVQTTIAMPMLSAILSAAIFVVFFIVFILVISLHRKEKARVKLEKEEDQRLNNEEEMLWKNKSANDQTVSDEPSPLFEVVTNEITDEQSEVTVDNNDDEAQENAISADIEEKEEETVVVEQAQTALNDTDVQNVTVEDIDSDETAQIEDEQETETADIQSVANEQQEVVDVVSESDVIEAVSDVAIDSIEEETEDSLDSESVVDEQYTESEVEETPAENEAEAQIDGEQTVVETEVETDAAIESETVDGTVTEPEVKEIASAVEAQNDDAVEAIESESVTNRDDSTSVLDKLGEIDFTDENSNLVEMLNSDEWSFLKDSPFNNITADNVQADIESESEKSDAAVDEQIENDVAVTDDIIESVELNESSDVVSEQETVDTEATDNNSAETDDAQNIYTETADTTEDVIETEVETVEQTSNESISAQIPNTDTAEISSMHLYGESDNTLVEQQPEDDGILSDVQLFNDVANEADSADGQIEASQETLTAMPITGDIEAAILNEQRRLSNFTDAINENCPSDVTESLIYRLYNASKISGSVNTDMDVIESVELEPSMDNYLPVEDIQ